MFIDYAVISVKAGDGGSGCVSFRREKFEPRGGPNGGNGGRGGSVILKADSSLWTLNDFRFKADIKAERGRHGSGKLKTGRNGDDVVLRVPAGTVVKEMPSGRVLADLVADGDFYVAAKGGRGGKGNAAMKSAVNRAPRTFGAGEAGSRARLAFELKIIADVGLIGSPNAGKSTLLGRMTNASPKVAGYPFTTVVPQIGVAEGKNFSHFKIAEIPGLIEGAHEGRGLGDKFLKHAERTKLILHIVDLSGDPAGDFRTVRNELRKRCEDIRPRGYIVAGNKTDIPDAGKQLGLLSEEAAKCVDVHKHVFGISALNGDGVAELKEFLAGEIAKIES